MQVQRPMAKPRTISFSAPDGISSRKQKPHFPRKRNTICSLVVNSESPRQLQPELDQICSESAKTNPSLNPTPHGWIAVKSQPFGLRSPPNRLRSGGRVACFKDRRTLKRIAPGFYRRIGGMVLLWLWSFGRRTRPRHKKTKRRGYLGKETGTFREQWAKWETETSFPFLHVLPDGSFFGMFVQTICNEKVKWC